MDDQNEKFGTNPEPQLSKKELGRQRQEEKREQRDREIQGRKTKKTLKWLIALIIIGLAIYGLVRWAAKAESERPGQAVADLGREHITTGAEHEPYNSNPPTSGPHHSAPAPWGIYDEPLPDETLVHNLEHGGIWISYRDDVDDETKAKLEALARRFPNAVILTPRVANDAPIALASWQRFMNLDEFDEDAILDYIKENINKSPEPLAR